MATRALGAPIAIINGICPAWEISSALIGWKTRIRWKRDQNFLEKRFFKFQEELTTETLETQFEIVRKETNLSHVIQVEKEIRNLLKNDQSSLVRRPEHR